MLGFVGRWVELGDGRNAPLVKLKKEAQTDVVLSRTVEIS